MLRRILLKLSLSCLLVLLFSEAVLRIQEPYWNLMKLHFNVYAQFVTHPEWDHWLRPSSNFEYRFSGDNHEGQQEIFRYRVDRYGCRYPTDVSLDKPLGTMRVIVMGDSFTQGYYYQDTVAAALERKLQAKLGSRVEVLNCASSSYSPLLHYARFTRQLVHLSPDAVIVNVDLNDVYDDYWRYRSRVGTDGEGGLLVRGPLSRWRAFVEWSKEHFYVARVLAGARSLLMPSHGAQDDPKVIFSYHSTLPIASEKWREEVDYCLSNLSRLIRFCQQRSIPILVTTYPYQAQLVAKEPDVLWHREFEKKVRALSESEGTLFYSAFDDMAKAFQTGRDIFLPSDTHYSPEGQRVWAEALSNNFVKQWRGME
ncbi:MAG: SGNH/GDSL hydrolase family protein [Acidobacteria bacterium]|nr:SGNH/GDSL hydrolase family protein [Acidobacteriota bacterium]